MFGRTIFFVKCTDFWRNPEIQGQQEQGCQELLGKGAQTEE